MSKSRIHLILIAALLLAGAVQTFGQTVASKADEGKLIAVLKNANAPHKDKVDACRQLAIIGGKDSVAPLAALLGDEKLSHMARYALEPNPDPAVNEALRDALGKVRGMPLVGVIGSLGVRRDTKAVAAMAKLLGDSNVEVARATARALGKIGNSEAADALQQAFAKAPAGNKLDICEGMLRCAESLAADGQRKQAVAIYDELRTADAPHQVRGGALRGAILTRQRNRQNLLQEHLQSDDYILFSAAVQTTLEMRSKRITSVLVDAMGDLPADNKILVIQAFGLRGDEAAVPAVLKAAKAGETPVRIAAMRAATELGDASAVPVLVGLLDDNNDEVAKAAQDCLATFPDKQANAAVMQMFRSDDADKQRVALDLMGRRRMTDGIPALLKAARDTDMNVRVNAVKMIGDLGGPDQLSAMLDLLSGARESKELAAVEQAIIAICLKSPDSQALADKLIGRLGAAAPAQKTALIRALGAVGGPKALKAVSAATESGNAEVRSAAVRAIGTWKTVDAAPVLLAMARKTGSQAERTLFLRGYLNLAVRGDMPLDQRLAMCAEAGRMIVRDDEKRLLLGTLSNIHAPETMELILPYLKDRGVRREAGMAAVTIADRMLRGRGPSPHAAKLIKPLEEVVQNAPNDNIAKRAKTLLGQARTKAGNK